jgi:AAA domain/Primase C terminal 2 (PriCT-2)/Bifunctional DNA primase/polymerase, N-terminal
MTQYFEEYGPRLAELGYTVLPIKPGTKRPDLKNWNTDPPDIERVRRGAVNGWAKHGTGVHAAHTPLIDVDVLDPELADQMSRAIDSIFPDTPLMTRTGLAPKFGVPMRSDTPFKKLTSKVYTDGTREHKVEILGDGQQWVAYADHPETGRPYAWFDGIGDEGIVGTPLASLPEITREDALRVVGAFEVLAAARVQAGLWRAVSAPPVERERPVADDPFAAHAPPTDLTPKEAEWVVKHLENTDATDYDEWFNTLCAIHHQLQEDGRDLAYEYSTRSSKHTDEKFELTWASLGRYTGAAATFASLLKRTGQPPKEEHVARSRPSEDDPFPQVEWSSFKQGFEAIPWIVKGLLPQAEIGFLYGASGSGKTFMALDLAATIARGAEWRGLKTTPVPVVYVAAEAGEGIKKRMAAYDQEFGTDGARPRIMASVPNLLSPDDAESIVKSTNLRGGAGLIIIDTMAASHTGDENSSKDMSMFVSLCKEISAKTGAMVLVVHHTGKDAARGVRGHSSLYAAADVVLEVFRNEEEKKSCLTVVKQKDGETGKEFGFSLGQVQVGVDPDGEAITTCVVRAEVKAPPKSVKTKTASPGFEHDQRFGKARHYLDIIAGLVGLGNDPVAESIVINAIQSDKIVNPESEEDFPRPDNIKRTLLTLAKQGKISTEGRLIRLLA